MLFYRGWGSKIGFTSTEVGYLSPFGKARARRGDHQGLDRFHFLVISSPFWLLWAWPSIPCPGHGEIRLWNPRTTIVLSGRFSVRTFRTEERSTW